MNLRGEQLDIAIGLSFWWEWRQIGVNGKTLFLSPDEKDSEDFLPSDEKAERYRSWRNSRTTRNIPLYHKNIEAALALLPDDADWQFNRLWYDYWIITVEVCFGQGHEHECVWVEVGPEHFDTQEEALATAICYAYLKIVEF
ncbi:hypothetical protein GF380_02595 [Candidatus Uhrbacteria bacterium]|nr:hypothetical protein [Candidatus Uhrbacteria bacterium]